ncbi:unnamed protein product, partial [Brenthis ino]
MENGRSVQYFVTFALSLATVTLGVSSAWPTPVLPKFRNNETGVNVTENEISTMLGMSAPGFMVGSLVAGFISDMFGRKMTVLASAAPFASGTLLAATAAHAWMLYLMKFLWGFGTGLVASVVTIYLAEVSDKEIRASLSICTRFMFNFGSLIIISIGAFLSYSTLNYSILSLPFIFFVTCLGIPESPHYYLKEGKVDHAKRSLMKLKGGKNIEEELELLKQNVKKEMKNSISPLDLFRGKTYGRPIVIATGLKVAQIMTGAITIQQYLGRITQDIDTDMKLSTHLIIFGVVKFVVGIISSIFADRIGRRPILICSFLGTGVCLVLAGSYFFLQEVIRLDQTDLRTFRYVPFISIILSNVIATMGFNAIIGVIQAEIFPLNVRAVAMTSLNILGGILGFIVPKCYQAIKNNSGLCGVFWIFSCVAFSGAIFSYFMVPETKGKSLHEIQEILKIGIDDVPTMDDGVSDVKVDETLELMEQKKENDLK